MNTCDTCPNLSVVGVIREACRLRVEHLPHIPMAVPDFRPFSELTALELSVWRLGNLALLPSLVGLVSPPGRATLPSHLGRSCCVLGVL